MKLTSIRMATVLVAAMVLLTLACQRPAAPTPAAIPSPVATPAVAPTPVPSPTVAATPVARPTGELRLALTYFGTETLDPTLGPPSGAKPTLWPLYDYLVGGTPEGRLSEETGLARKWEVSHSATRSVYTFYLRQGVKFHNGDEVTAEDVKFSLEYFSRPASVTPAARLFRETIDRIEVPERYKVVVYTKAPYGNLHYDLSLLASGTEGMVLPKKYIEEKGEANFLRNPVGSGPYKLKEHMPGSYIKFEAVDNHWLVGVPRYKTLTLLVVPEETTRIALLKVGQADVININLDKAKELRAAGFQVFVKPGAYTGDMRLHNTWEAGTYLNDIRVREALNLAVNREEIVKFLFQGLGAVTGNPPRFGSWHLAYEPFPLYPYDPGRAKKLLAEAFPQGVALTINSFSRPGADLPRLNEAISGMWGEVGIKTKIVPMDYASHRALMGKGALPNTAAARDSAQGSTHGVSFHNLWHSAGLLSSVRMPALDALIEASMAKVDLMDIARAEAQAFRFMRENHLTVPVAEIDFPVAANPKKVTQWDLGKIPYDHNFLALIRQER